METGRAADFTDDADRKRKERLARNIILRGQWKSYRGCREKLHERSGFSKESFALKSPTFLRTCGNITL